MRSIELTFDAVTETTIRADWAALAAGLPRLASHTGSSNRPHLTLAADPADSAAPGAVEQTAPDRWVPHVTLARRLDAAGLGTALTLLGGPRPWQSPPVSGTPARRASPP